MDAARLENRKVCIFTNTFVSRQPLLPCPWQIDAVIRFPVLPIH
jgi:hypothetical protein